MDNYQPYGVNSKKSKLREVVFFLVITFISLVFPGLFYSLESSSFTVLALTTILRNLGLSFLVFWFLKGRVEEVAGRSALCYLCCVSVYSIRRCQIALVKANEITAI